MISHSILSACDADVDFIMDEMKRHREAAERRAEFQEAFGEGPAALLELMAKLKHKDTGQELTVGRAAIARFGEIAKRLVAAENDSYDWDEAVLSERLRQSFLSFLFKPGISNTVEMIQPWLEDSVRFCKSRHRRWTHHFPCVALQIGDLDRYEFGGVLFQKKEIFFSEHAESFQRYEFARDRLSERGHRNATPSQRECLAKHRGKKPKEALEIFRDFTNGVDWIASIAVPPCSSTVSETRAEKCLRFVLSALALLLEGEDGGSLRLAGDPVRPWRTDSLSSKGKVFRLGSSWKFGGARVANDWREYVEEAAAPVLAVLEEVSRRILSGSHLSYGHRLVIRSASWYADAIRESSLEARLFKFATAVECLVLPERGNATATFVIRGALLAQSKGVGVINCAEFAQSLYAKRSAISHGDLDFLDNDPGLTIGEALNFTRNAILQFVKFCGHLKPLGNTRLGTKVDLLELYSAIENKFASDVDSVIARYRFGRWKRPAKA